MSTSSNRYRALALAAVLAVVATGAAMSAATAGARTNVNAVAYRLNATMTPGQVVPAISAPASASGHFHGILFRSGIGAARVAALAGCKVVVAPKRSGLPTRIQLRRLRRGAAGRGGPVAARLAPVVLRLERS